MRDGYKITSVIAENLNRFATTSRDIKRLRVRIKAFPKTSLTAFKWTHLYFKHMKRQQNPNTKKDPAKSIPTLRNGNPTVTRSIGKFRIKRDSLTLYSPAERTNRTQLCSVRLALRCQPLICHTYSLTLANGSCGQACKLCKCSCSKMTLVRHWAEWSKMGCFLSNDRYDALSWLSTRVKRERCKR